MKLGAQTMPGVVLRDVAKLPNLMSLARLPLAVAFALVSDRPVLAIAVLLVAGTTDVVDGWIARHFRLETALGRMLDGVMDKVFVLVVVLSLLARGSLSFVDALLLGTREIGELPLALRALLHDGGHPRPVRGANAAGKLATVLQFVALIAILLRDSHARIFIWAAAACGAAAAISYWRREGRTEV